MPPVTAQTTEFLTTYLNDRVKRLHRAISLREDDSTLALASFVERYVELAPEFITAFENFLAFTDINGEIAQQISTAKEFLESPASLVSPQEGLEANMYQAYLTHRLLEELNDLLFSHYNCSVIPVDMTRSNLIIHHLIGEPFANQIDNAIQLLSNKLAKSIQGDTTLSGKLQAYTNQLGTDPIDRHPCLTDSSQISLLFNSQNTRIRLH